MERLGGMFVRALGSAVGVAMGGLLAALIAVTLIERSMAQLF